MVDRNMLHACHPRWSFSAPTHSVRQRIQVRHCVCQGNRNTPVPAPPDGARAHTPGWMQVVIVQYEMVMSKPDMGMLKSLSWSYMVVDEVSHVSALPLCHVSWPRCASVPSLLQRERVGAGGGGKRDRLSATTQATQEAWPIAYSPCAPGARSPCGPELAPGPALAHRVSVCLYVYLRNVWQYST